MKTRPELIEDLYQARLVQLGNKRDLMQAEIEYRQARNKAIQAHSKDGYQASIRNADMEKPVIKALVSLNEAKLAHYASWVESARLNQLIGGYTEAMDLPAQDDIDL
jgi:hypothetical protein